MQVLAILREEGTGEDLLPQSVDDALGIPAVSLPVAPVSSLIRLGIDESTRTVACGRGGYQGMTP